MILWFIIYSYPAVRTPFMNSKYVFSYVGAQHSHMSGMVSSGVQLIEWFATYWMLSVTAQEVWVFNFVHCIQISIYTFNPYITISQQSPGIPNVMCNVNKKVNRKTWGIERWAASWQNQQCGCAPSEDSDQPGHPPSLFRVFAVRSMGSHLENFSV